MKFFFEGCSTNCVQFFLWKWNHLTFPDHQALCAKFRCQRSLYLGKKTARRPERLENQKQTEPPGAKWLYQTLGVGGKVKERERTPNYRLKFRSDVRQTDPRILSVEGYGKAALRAASSRSGSDTALVSSWPLLNSYSYSICCKPAVGTFWITIRVQVQVH
jgi:hypothetical protein